MARPLAFAVALVGVVSLFPAAQGCTGDATTCTYVYATSYDQSCTTDSDCVAVVDGTGCCPNSSVNVSVQAKYTADFQKSFAACGGEAQCVGLGGCANIGPCCVGGTCQMASGSCAHPMPVGNSDACLGAGGQCAFRSLPCAGVVGPQDCGNEAAVCCIATDAGSSTAEAGVEAGTEACAPSGCNTACPAGTRDVSSMVNGCLVTECCVPDDTGAEAATDAASDSGPLDANGR
jgi:hypothetical protein